MLLKCKRKKKGKNGVLVKFPKPKQDILESVLNYMVDPQAKYYEGNTWEDITIRVQKEN